MQKNRTHLRVALSEIKFPNKPAARNEPRNSRTLRKHLKTLNEGVSLSSRWPAQPLLERGSQPCTVCRKYT